MPHFDILRFLNLRFCGSGYSQVAGCWSYQIGLKRFQLCGVSYEVSGIMEVIANV